MGLAEVLIAIVLAGTTGYHAGKAGQKVENYEAGEVCFDQDYNDRKQGCYTINKHPKPQKRQPASK